MKELKIVRKVAILGSFVLLVGIGGIYFSQQISSTSQFSDLGPVSTFELTDQRGQPFGKEDLLGKVTVVDFFFTNCPGACPVMNYNIEQLYNRFAGNKRVQFVSITIDPVRDTLAALRQYAEDHGVTDDRWKFLRGSREKVAWLSQDVFHLTAEPPNTHSTRFAIADQEGHIRGYYRGTEETVVEEVTAVIRKLLKKEPAERKFSHAGSTTQQ